MFWLAEAFKTVPWLDLGVILIMQSIHQQLLCIE
jgi:hypothetical protein